MMSLELQMMNLELQMMLEMELKISAQPRASAAHLCAVLCLHKTPAWRLSVPKILQQELLGDQIFNIPTAKSRIFHRKNRRSRSPAQSL